MLTYYNTKCKVKDTSRTIHRSVLAHGMSLIVEVQNIGRPGHNGPEKFQWTCEFKKIWVYPIFILDKIGYAISYLAMYSLS